MDEKWENLIILDACRYDSFEENVLRTGFNGRLELRQSRGTDTRTFLEQNFSHGSHPEIVYVTANPVVSRFLRGRVGQIVPVWKLAWDEQNNTVMPGPVCDYALEARRRFPKHRLIIHFMQPHYPFVGYKLEASTFKGRPRPLTCYAPTWSKWEQFMVYSDPSDTKALYNQNLAFVMNYVQDLATELTGLTVITADHGESFGDRLSPLFPIRVYEHPPRVAIRSLITVPWFIVGPQVRTQSLGHPVSYTVDEVDDEELIKQRLKLLGYE